MKIVAGIGLFIMFLSFITLIGICHFGRAYRRFFNTLTRLDTLAFIKRSAALYLKVLNRFLGTDVGLKQQGVLKKSKYVGRYLERLLLLYWIGGTVLVLSFRPVDDFGQGVNSLAQAAAFVILLTFNVGSDAFSFLWTKRCIAMIAVPRRKLTVKTLFSALAQDIGVAVGLMLLVQLVSNGLYAIQIGRPDEIFRYVIDIRTAIKPYAPVDPRFGTWQIPGQLIITCTGAYIPTFLFYFLSIMILLLHPIYKLAIGALILCRVDPEKARCDQPGFLTALATIVGTTVACVVALAS